jgi:hypothetical protein
MSCYRPFLPFINTTFTKSKNPGNKIYYKLTDVIILNRRQTQVLNGEFTHKILS